MIDRGNLKKEKLIGGLVLMGMHLG